jgi:argininosuccinate lyase
LQKKPWGGRFKKPTHSLTQSYTESISFDKRLYKDDIEGSMAHAAMLAREGIISQEEAAAITRIRRHTP